MIQLMRRLLHEIGTGRALVNASDEQAQEAMLLLRVDALGRRLAASAVAPPERTITAA